MWRVSAKKGHAPKREDARCWRANGERMQDVFVLKSLIFNVDERLLRFAIVSISDPYIFTNLCF
jgi:hypothetical protein